MDTIRETALIALENVVATMATDPDYMLHWGRVSRAPLIDADWKKKYSCGVHDTTEKVDRTANFWYRSLNVVIEFRVTVEQNESPSQEAGRVLGQLQRRIMENDTLGGVVINVQEGGNELYVDFEDARKVSGALFVVVQYRHAENDPRKTA